MSTAVIGNRGAPRSSKPRLQATNQPVFVAGLVIVVLSLLSGFATYLILTGLTPIVPTHTVVITVLLINAILAIAMLGMIIWQAISLWNARRRQAAGARLHIRIVSLFSFIAVVPAILLAIFASISLDRGLDHWFSSRTKSILQNSISVANAYLQEHGQVIRSDAISMGRDMDEAVDLVQSQPETLNKFLIAQAQIRSLPLAYLINGKGEVIAAAQPQSSEMPYREPPKRALELAQSGKPIVIGPGKTDLVASVRKLKNYDDTYLYILRRVNPQVLQHLMATRAGVAEYQRLEQRRAGVQVAFGLMYVAIALTLLLAAIWIGLWFANRLVAPIRQLISAADRISSGDLNVAVAVSQDEGDLDQLSSTFNTMTTELRSQRDELVNANTMLDDRRRFIEAVLSGVTAGVIGLDADGTVTLANPSAEDLLNTTREKLIGRTLGDAVPEFEPLLERAHGQDDVPVHDHVNIFRDAEERNFAMRVTTERAGDKDYGYVVTFDDITELVSAQRTSAWADVARRIAHEIKNPLTPIQLSAERIRRKYGSVITKDREIFEQCTDTIVRQVGDIGRMVDEFSSFARMPKPVMEESDARDLVREAVVLFQVSDPGITFNVEVPDEPVITLCDRRLISQAVTNLVKNATEAIEAAAIADKDGGYKGEIDAKVEVTGGRFSIEVTDNGIGLPAENRNRLVEPYMTTREKGTGLGLAIVQKVTEQHGGTLQLRDAPTRNGGSSGASVRLEFPIVEPAQRGAHDEVHKDADKPEMRRDVRGEKQGASHGV